MLFSGSYFSDDLAGTSLFACKYESTENAYYLVYRINLIKLAERLPPIKTGIKLIN